MNLEKIKKDLTFLKDYEVVLYGSYVTEEARVGSDIDVAVITRIKDRDKNVELLKSFIGKTIPVYDIRIFELLPLKLKASMMDDYLVLYGEELEISEYFYYYRKLWNDQKHRIIGGYHKNYKEKTAAMRFSGDMR
ncbi:MAG TPA: nucleotidyltransferase domain-containing protein [Euryarchaeota archaeon]|nr:nucleotidyltransferase domain protein [archaeon BMS3Bbin15]HDL15117.1 nucleotidyltransferase domain-containing protein [Euryarchaeota archaeon]